MELQLKVGITDEKKEWASSIADALELVFAKEYNGKTNFNQFPEEVTRKEVLTICSEIRGRSCQW